MAGFSAAVNTASMSKLTHVDSQGKARMVNVTEKSVTARKAIAQAWVMTTHETFLRIAQNEVEKGDVLSAARLAGIMAAKRTGELIPLCHPLNLTHVGIDFELHQDQHRIRIVAECEIESKTGVEMEALVAVSVAALTIYDMCKALDKAMTISDICLLQKKGGKSGSYERSNND